MNSDASWKPEWRTTPPSKESYRSIFQFDPNRITTPDAAWLSVLQDELGFAREDFDKERPTGDAPVRLEKPSALTPEQIAKFATLAGNANATTDDYSRVRYGYGKSLDENLELRHGRADHVPDIVVHPRDKADVKAIVEYCNEQRLPIIPCGGRSGVVLGTRATRGGVAVVMRTHMNKLLSLNEKNQTAVVQPGMLGPDYEAALNAAPTRFGTKRSYTCGHFPQSFELATVGGWILALGSGQASTYYGDACDIVTSQEFVTPAGTFKTLDIPATATGPKVNDIMKGSEGAYGILVEATLKVFRHMPENRRYFSFMYPSWEAAVNASREIVQGEFGMPAVFRISDGEETELGLRLKGYTGGAIDKYLSFRGMQPNQRCICIGTAEGETRFTKNVQRQIAGIARAHGAVSLGEKPAKKWEHSRYSDIHIRESLLDRGVILDTLETGVAWDRLLPVYEGVRAFAKQRPHTVCMTHASHFYPQGANLYFIFMLKPDDPQEFFAFRRDIVNTIVERGGSISHHHGIGRMFAPWMDTSLGAEQIRVLRAIKRHLDPNNIMNPGGTLGLDEQ